MLEIIFNKGIANLEDSLSHTLQPKGYSQIELVNIRFEIGYEYLSEMSLKINNGEKQIAFSPYKNLSDNPEWRRIDINKHLLFNGSPIDLKTDLHKPFNFILYYEYYNTF